MCVCVRSRYMYFILFNVRKAQPTLYSSIHSTNVCPSNVTSNNDDERTTKKGKISTRKKEKTASIVFKIGFIELCSCSA